MPRANKARVLRGGRARSDVVGSARRLVVGRALLALALVITGGKLIEVQGFQAAALSQQAQRQLTTPMPIPAVRGSIVDRDGNVLALSSEARQLYANPKSLGEQQDAVHAKDPSKPTGDQYKHQIASYVHQVVGDQLPEQQVLAALQSNQPFTYFGPMIDPGKARQITEKFPQIGAEYRARRQYPGGGLAANVLGAATWRKDENKLTGLMGLENSLDPLLAGRDGRKVADTAAGSNLIIPGTEHQLEPSTPGSNVQLTLDSDVQFLVQQKLADYVRKAGAKDGSAVVLDAKTGEVYALANGKTFDPGNPATWTNDALGNPAVTNPYEPGSVNKVITAAGAIEYGLTRPDTVQQVPGEIRVADRTINDAWQHGTIPLTFTGILAKSSNVGTLLTAQRLGPDRFADLVRRFGLGQRTGVGLPGESPGSVPARDQWSGSTFANLPIGQGLSMTALQMAGMYQTIANDGVRMPPRIVSEEIQPNGQRVDVPRPLGVRVVSPETAHTVRDMLRAVVQKAPGGQTGTGPSGALEGYQISGKTGTAQQIDPSCGCYSNSKYWITFAGMLPADNPRFVVGLMLDAPQSGTTESVSAAPLFHEIASYLAQRYQIPLSPEPAPVQTLQLPQP